jgi:hypothetical protein
MMVPVMIAAAAGKGMPSFVGCLSALNNCQCHGLEAGEGEVTRGAHLQGAWALLWVWLQHGTQAVLRLLADAAPHSPIEMHLVGRGRGIIGPRQNREYMSTCQDKRVQQHTTSELDGGASLQLP